MGKRDITQLGAGPTGMASPCVCEPRYLELIAKQGQIVLSEGSSLRLETSRRGKLQLLAFTHWSVIHKHLNLGQ